MKPVKSHKTSTPVEKQIAQGFFCKLSQVFARDLGLRLTWTFKSYIRSAGQPLLTDLVQDRRDQT